MNTDQPKFHADSTCQPFFFDGRLTAIAIFGDLTEDVSYPADVVLASRLAPRPIVVSNDIFRNRRVVVSSDSSRVENGTDTFSEPTPSGGVMRRATEDLQLVYQP